MCEHQAFSTAMKKNPCDPRGKRIMVHPPMKYHAVWKKYEDAEGAMGSVLVSACTSKCSEYKTNGWLDGERDGQRWVKATIGKH